MDAISGWVLLFVAAAAHRTSCTTLSVLVWEDARHAYWQCLSEAIECGIDIGNEGPMPWLDTFLEELHNE